jgi:hypothetical protein
MTAQAASDNTQIQKIATRGERRSVRRLPRAAASDVEISKWGALGIFR